jgi:hypothetical protein
MRQQYFAGLVLGALGLVVGAACSSKTEVPYPDEATFCTAKAKAICQVSSLCAIDPTACQATQVHQCNADAMAVGANRTYSADNAKTCVDAVNAAYGDAMTRGQVPYATLTDIATKCARVFTGNAAANAPCTSDYDCASGLVCSPAVPGATTMVCAKPLAKALGDFCLDPGSQCAPDSYCAKQTNMTWMCTAAAAQGAPCDDATPCVSTQHCVGSICQPRATAGQSCTADSDCSPTPAPYCDHSAGYICTVGQTFAAGAFDCKGFAGQATPGPEDAGATPEAGAHDASGE